MGYLQELHGMTDREKQYREELFKLMRENPDLPVIPMVDSEIWGGDFGRWLGAWGSSYVGEYLIGEEQIYFREDDDPSEVERAICDILGYDRYENMSDEEADRTYREFPWVKAIIVNIDSAG